MPPAKKTIPLFCLLLLLCCLLTASSEDMVKLSTGWVRTDAVVLRKPVTEEDLSALEQMEDLHILDAAGSSCYDGLMAWHRAHPETAVRYTVAFPDGSCPENGAQELDLSGLDPACAGEALPLLQYLPELKTVDLGSAPGGLSPEQAALFIDAYPEIRFSYRFDFLGETVSADAEALDLSGRGHEAAQALLPYLPVMRQLKTVDLGSDRQEHMSWEDIAKLQAACPGAEFHYEFELFGRPFSLTDTAMDLRYVPMDDGGAAVRQAISCMPALKSLDMDSCGVSNADMLALRADFPQVDIVWRVRIAEKYSVRTDVERLLISMPQIGGNVDDRNDLEALSCCNKVRYLDIGHNLIVSDISFVASMPELRVAILAMNDWSDASPLANCPHLEYLELQTTNLSDVSPLAGLKELRHLNLCYLTGLRDISPLYGLTQLKRLWLGCLDPVPAEQVAKMQELAPGCEINTTTLDPTFGGWRVDRLGELTPRYKLLRVQFGNYSTDHFSFAWNDPLYRWEYD